MPKKFEFVIVGAGIAGLTLADQLSQKGKKVLLIERNNKIGGLARSFHYHHKGKKYIFDIGPKRFHTEDPEVLAYILSVLGKQKIIIGRKSAVYLFGQFFDWPITIKDVFALPFFIQLKITIDIVLKLLRKPLEQGLDRFDKYIINTYGQTLYNHFFRGYTEKFLNIPANTVHADWATTGINRSIIDKRAKGNSIFELIKSIIVPHTIKTKFIYPKRSGFGYFCDKLGRRIKRQGGQIRTNMTIVKMNPTKHSLTLGKEKIIYQELIWTGNLHDLGLLLGESFSDLNYLSTIFFHIVVKQSLPRKDQWIYFGEDGLAMVRVSFPQNFAKYTGQRGKTLFTVEKTFTTNLLNKVNLREVILQELVSVGLLKNRKAVERIWIETIHDTYPIYHLHYKQSFARVVANIQKKYTNIRLLGRSGAFWYNNSDHSIKAAIGMAKFFLGERSVEPEIEEIFSGKKH